MNRNCIVLLRLSYEPTKRVRMCMHSDANEDLEFIALTAGSHDQEIG